MKTLGSGRHFIGIGLVVVLLAGCGGSQAGGPGALPMGGAAANRPAHGHSWMLPKASGEDLLYIARELDVLVYSYPQAKLVGSVTLGNGYYPAGGLCTDGNGDVFVPAHSYSGDNSVYEYAHGGTSPIAVLNDSTYFPLSCSVDPSTGNLAVTNSYAVSKHLYGNVAIYQKAQGSPEIYSDSSFRLYTAPAYDNQGNLFITGYGNTPSSLFALAELPTGGSTFENLAIDQDAFQYDAGRIQWDGKYLAIAAEKNDAPEPPILVYRVQVTGSTASIVKTVHFNDWKHSLVSNFWIQDGKLISNAGGNHGHWKRVAFWKYPGGGKVVKYFSARGYAFGVAVSVAAPGSHIRQ